MMSDTESVSQGVTMEEAPSGKIVPEWLFESLVSGKRLMIIYPSESSRIPQKPSSINSESPQKPSESFSAFRLPSGSLQNTL